MEITFDTKRKLESICPKFKSSDSSLCKNSSEREIYIHLKSLTCLQQVEIEYPTTTALFVTLSERKKRGKNQDNTHSSDLRLLPGDFFMI